MNPAEHVVVLIIHTGGSTFSIPPDNGGSKNVFQTECGRRDCAPRCLNNSLGSRAFRQHPRRFGRLVNYAAKLTTRELLQFRSFLDYRYGRTLTYLL